MRRTFFQDGKARSDVNVHAIKRTEWANRSENRVGIYADCVGIEFDDRLWRRRNGATANSAGAAVLPVIHASNMLTNSFATERSAHHVSSDENIEMNSIVKICTKS